TWHTRAEIKLRVGIHWDRLDSVEIEAKPSVFGEGISECVRVMTAANPNQALVSHRAHKYLGLKDHAAFKLADDATFFDKHGVKHVAAPLGLARDDHWGLQ